MNGLFPPSAPCPLWDRALSVSRWGHRTLRGAIFSHCLRRGAHRAPAVPREWPQFLRRGGSQTRPPHRCEAGGRKPPHPSQHTPCHLPPSGGKALGAAGSRPYGDPFSLCVGVRIVCPPFSTSGPGFYVGTGLAPARFHPKDARKGFRPAGQNPSGTGTGVERPLIRHGICRDTFPPVGGRLFGRLEAAPTGSPSVFA